MALSLSPCCATSVMPADAPSTSTDAASTLVDLELPMAVSPAARLVVERVAGITVVGWAFDPQAPGQEHLNLVCGAQTFPAQVRRLSRGDVSRAVGATDAVALGFEIDLPLPIWQALGQAGAV